MEQLTTYRTTGIKTGLIFLFKYDLKGFLKVFEIAEGELLPEQEKWLYSINHFPSNEAKMQYWSKDKEFTEKFIVEVSPADISFEALWVLFDNKVAKADAIKAFKKLKEEDIIKCFIEVPYYLQYLKQNPGIGKLHLATYINKRRFEDERPILKGKNQNPILAELAFKKTDKK